MPNPDFQWTPEWWYAIPKDAQGGYYALMIERHIRPEEWKDWVGRIPEDRRQEGVEYLRDRWRIWQNRQRMKAKGKHSSVAERELEKMGALVKNL